MGIGYTGWIGIEMTWILLGLWIETKTRVGIWVATGKAIRLVTTWFLGVFRWYWNLGMDSGHLDLFI
jgi:hypothetical protein